MIRRAGGLLLTASAFLAAACAEQRLRSQAERAVREYNDSLVLAYRMSDAGRLAGAGEAEKRRVGVLIDLKRSAELVLEARVESLEVARVMATANDGAKVRTRERWRYHDRSTRPGAPVGPNFLALMDMEYELTRQADRLVVERGRTLSSEYLEPKGFAPGSPVVGRPR